VVVTTGGVKLHATNTGMLSTRALSKGAWEAIVVPGMRQGALMSVATLANHGYTTVFLPGQQGVNVFNANDVTISATTPPALQGWRDGTGLWMVPIANCGPTSIQSWQRRRRKRNGRVRITKHKRSCPILTRSIGISYTSNVTYRSPTWQPCHISGLDTNEHCATPS
jgi:hypothetical protein